MAPISAVVYYDGEIGEDEFGVVFRSDHYILLSFKRNITLHDLITKISRKARVGNTRRLSTLQYRFPTEILPLMYTPFALSHDDDVAMMVDASSQNSDSILEMYATFVDVHTVRGMSLSSHYGLPQQVHQVDSPTTTICNDFTSLMANPPPSSIPSSSRGRHSSANFFDLNIEMPSSSRGRHSSASFFDRDMEMPSTQHSIHNPYDDIPSSSRGRHSSVNLFDLNIEITQEPSSPPEEPLREPGADGAETGLFIEPESPYFNIDSDDDADEVPINMVQSDPPAQYVSEADYDAMYAPEFPDLPNVGDYGRHLTVTDGDLHRGMEFSSKEEAMMAIKNYNICNSVHSKVDRSTAEKYVCYCVERDNGCNWMVRVSKRKRKNNIWELTKYNGPHTCCARGINQDHRNLDSNVICQAIMPMVKASSHIAIAVLISAIQSQYGYTVSYRKAWKAKQLAITKLHGEWDSSYNELPSWFNLVQRLNPGTVVEFETCHAYENDRVLRDRCQFYRIFWTYPQCINAVKYCKPVVQIDGTFLYGKYKQVLLLAVVQDGNRNILPVAFALVEGEDTESWAFFLRNLRLHVITRERICIISDRGAGIKAAMDSLGPMWKPPHVQHRLCIRHIAANYHGRYKKNDERQLIIRMGYELLPQRFEFMLQELQGKNERGYNYISEINREMWTNAYDGGYRYGHMTTNLAEAINSTLKGARHLPVTALAKTTYFRLGQLFAKLGGQALTWMQNGHVYHPRLVADLHQKVAASNSMSVISFSRTQELFRVTEMPRPLQGIESNSFRVNLRERWCDCGFFQALKYPCSHVISACSFSRQDYKRYVDPVYQLSEVFKVYEYEFPPIGSEKDPNEVQTWLPIIPDPNLLRESGRPKSTRIHCDMDIRETSKENKRCGICRNVGHNRKNCPSFLASRNR